MHCLHAGCFLYAVCLTALQTGIYFLCNFFIAIGVQHRLNHFLAKPRTPEAQKLLIQVVAMRMGDEEIFYPG